MTVQHPSVSYSASSFNLESFDTTYQLKVTRRLRQRRLCRNKTGFRSSLHSSITIPSIHFDSRRLVEGTCKMLMQFILDGAGCVSRLEELKRMSTPRR